MAGSLRRRRKNLTPLPQAVRSVPWKAPEPVGAKYAYLLTTPRTKLLPDDVVGGCKFSETDFQVDLKFGWISGGNPIITQKLIRDEHVADRSVQAIVAAAP